MFLFTGGFELWAYPIRYTKLGRPVEDRAALLTSRLRKR